MSSATAHCWEIPASIPAARSWHAEPSGPENVITKDQWRPLSGGPIGSLHAYVYSACSVADEKQTSSRWTCIRLI
jgi:hypothetical protein